MNSIVTWARPDKQDSSTEDIDYLRKLLHYCPETGLITWIVNLGPGKPNNGDEAGTIGKKGYRQIQIGRKTFYAHRVAWALHNGKWPDMQIDHINGVRDDNRACNIRDVSASHNIQNRRKAHKNNHSGSTVPGVSWDRSSKKFRVTGRKHGKYVHIGLFADISDAESASIEFRRATYKGNTL